MGEGTGSSGKRRNKTSRNKAPFLNPDSLDGANSEKKRKIVARNKKREGAKLPEAETTEIVVSTSPDDAYDGKISAGMSDKKKKKLKIKKRNKESTKEDGVCEYVPSPTKVGDDSNQQSDNLDGANSVKKRKKIARKKKIEGAELPEAETTETVDEEEGKNSSAGISNKKKSKLKKKKRNKENTKVDDVRHSNEDGDNSNQQNGKSKGASELKNDATLLDEDEDEVYQISSGDEDETTGMKRWIAEYHRARPGADVLLERIDDFLVDYWEQKEKEGKEREAEAAEGGWTVVKHIKGRKKTTDGESGTTMGSVAEAAVIDKMSKKKKDKQHVVGLNFYRFQRREAQRNEIMMLQSKFEQDKKRIQQMRAARKFRPY